MASFVDFFASLGLVAAGVVAFLMAVDPRHPLAPSERVPFLSTLAIVIVSVVWVLARFWSL